MLFCFVRKINAFSDWEIVENVIEYCCISKTQSLYYAINMFGQTIMLDTSTYNNRWLRSGAPLSK